MISAVFVDRPRLAIVLAILVTLAGVLSLLRIPVAQFPDIVPPQVTISTSYAGASAAVVEATVAQPLEAQIIGVDKMIYMKSNSGNDGSYSLTVSFELGTNPDIDTVNVNNRVQQALSKLPPEVQRYGLTVRKRSAAILEFLQFYSEGGKQDPLFISNYVTINVLDRLARTPGVGDAQLFGRLDYSMRIWFDMNRLISLDLAPSDIIAAIQQQNVQAPVGRIGARPTSDATQFQLNVQTQGRLITAEQFGHIVIRANPDGSVLRLSDIARIELGAANMDTESRLNGDPAVSIGLFLAPGANAVQTSARVQAALDELGKRFPDGLKSRIFYDSSSFVAATIDEVEKTLAIAFALVVLVVFLFLGNIRATIIPIVAIPVSLIGTFAVLLAVGFSANTVSLLALVLGIGVVVDDAIVVVENAERVMAENPDMPPGEATKMAMRRDHRADHRDHARATIGIRAGRLYPRRLRRIVPSVRGDDQRGDADLGAERADVVAGTVRRVSASPRPTPRANGLGAAAHRQCARRICRGRAAAGTRVAPAASRRSWRQARRSTSPDANADRFSARRGSGGVLCLGAVARRRFGRRTRGRPAASRNCCGRCRKSRTSLRSSATRSSTASASRTQPFSSRCLKPFEERSGAANSAQALIARVLPRDSRSAANRDSV